MKFNLSIKFLIVNYFKSVKSLFERLIIGMVVLAIFLTILPLNPKEAQAANFAISPASGAYAVGSTFDVQIQIDTKGQSINAVQMELFFPPDKLQLVSPSAGTSVISIYTTPPKYDNSTGRVEIVGGIPNGINVSNGLIAKLTFRVKSLGSASLRFGGNSQILLNDGRGTNVLDNSFGATYKLEFPPQQGPIVISNTHPDQEIWYREKSVNLQWDIGLPPAQGYSYTISDRPDDIPDNTVNTTETQITYRDVPNGINYFHIKALRDGRWGGVSHYGLKIDTEPPADFPIEVIPGTRTFVTKPVFQFGTTDKLSGLSRYELMIITHKLSGRNKAQVTEQLFIEVQSPYISESLAYGTYSVVVRGYDIAGNFREASQKFEITDSWFWFLSQDGAVLPGFGLVRWQLIIPILLILIVLALLIAWWLRHHYLLHHQKVQNNLLPQNIASQLEELQKFRAKYGKVTVWVLALAFASQIIFAQAGLIQAQELVPPVISSYSANIKDDELFYVSGRTQEANSEVIVHLQSMVDGNSFDFSTISDKRGDWTYRHNDFLPGGKYIIWAHSKQDSSLSVPSPQVEMDVKPVAINWGNSRITYQSLYIGLIIALSLLLLILLGYIVVHAVLVRRRRHEFSVQLRQAEDSIKRGFLALRRDIEAELLLVKQAHLPADLAGEQRVREQQLQEDLKNIEGIVGRELWEVETFEQLPRAEN